jgi:homoserine O-acetyltransferase/O-succinyltransferase
MQSVLEPQIDGLFAFAESEPFRLRAGGQLAPVELRYAAYGELNRKKDNAILVCHALSGSARVADWWPEIIGPGRPLDTSRYCVIGINVIGSCYGSTGPASIDPQTGERYAETFPLVTINDIVRAQGVLIDHLGIGRLHAVIGGSIGGMQALEWATAFPERVARAIAIGAAPLSALGLALNHLQREAIRNDPAWQGGRYAADSQPVAGLALARKIAMCTYKAEDLFSIRFHRRPNRAGDDPWQSLSGRFDVAGYLDYQGESFTRRFDANAYIALTKAMDLFDVAYPGESEREKLERVCARLLLVGITSDWLFPPAYVRQLADQVKEAGVEVQYTEFSSDHGHDAFLADADRLGPLIAEEIERAVVCRPLDLVATHT